MVSPMLRATMMMSLASVGRRLMPGDPTQRGNAAPDLNQIPAALIERVEVLALRPAMARMRWPV